MAASFCFTYIVVRTTAYLKAIMEVYGKTVTDLDPTGIISCAFTAVVYIHLKIRTLRHFYTEM